MSFVAGCRGRHQALPDPIPQDMPDDHRQDPDNAADFELPDHQELIDAFMAGLSKESQHDCRGPRPLSIALPSFLIRVTTIDRLRQCPFLRQESEVSYLKLARSHFEEKVFISLSYDLIIVYI